MIRRRLAIALIADYRSQRTRRFEWLRPDKPGAVLNGRMQSSAASRRENTADDVRPTHVVLHDYSGHPFQAQLSRALASRGHIVEHWYCASYETGRGAVARRDGDPATLRFRALPMKGAFDRYSPAKRIKQELSYGWGLAKSLLRTDPDTVIMCNTPLLAHAVAAVGCTLRGVPAVFWLQDIYSSAIEQAARRKLGIWGMPIGVLASRIERWIARRARGIVAISPDFMPVLQRWGVADRSCVIPNWAPVDEIPTKSQRNSWSIAKGLAGRTVVLYAGTLGLKHDPSVLRECAKTLLQFDQEARLVVASQGIGREWLDKERGRLGLLNLLLLDYQRYEDLPDMLGTADVLLAILEPAAGKYSVPSKVLSYLCAGRPILAVVPQGNPAAAILQECGGGLVVDPHDAGTVPGRLLELLQDPERRARMGRLSREYACSHFNVEVAATQFERLFPKAVASREGLSPALQTIRP